LKNPLSGRINRRLYLIYTFGYLVLFGSVKLLVPAFPAEAALPAIWILLIAWRRLHDFGWRGWWACTPLVLGFVIGFVRGFTRALQGLEPTPNQPFGSGGDVLVALVTIALMIWLGVQRGDAGANRFGEGPMRY